MTTAELVQTAIEHLKVNGGFSLSLEGETPTAGYMVAVYPELETKLDSLSPLDITSYLRGNASILARPAHYFGGWIDEHIVYLDVSICVSGLFDALTLATEHNQLAVYDVSHGQSVYLQKG